MVFNIFQRILPKHSLSRLLGKLAHWQNPNFKNCAIRLFMNYFKVDMTEASVTDIRQFSSFNDFFIRHLKPNARPLPVAEAAIACPADGVVSELGQIQQQQLLQAKGRYYSLSGLLGGDSTLVQHFREGKFFTVYLAPKNYHRVHMPVTGRLLQMTHIPGELFSVNTTSANSIPQLFARNERVVCLFETTVGKMAVIFVGALLIGSVVTTWHGQVMPVPNKQLTVKVYRDAPMLFQRGDELGYFQWGSTVIVLFESARAHWEAALHAGASVQVGQTIGCLTPLPGEC